MKPSFPPLYSCAIENNTPNRTKRILAFSLLVVAAALAFGLRPIAAQPSAGTIAYIEDDARDEIRLISPDGSNDRFFWEHGVPDANNQYDLWNLAWKPDGSELAFAGSHEGWCSLNRGDIFAISAAGTGYRRITESPACGALGSFPTGTVHIPVENNTFASVSGFVYFQGAPTLLPVNLPPGGSDVLTFTDVADFGNQFMQLAIMIVGANRAPDIATAVDVQAGSEVTTGPMDVYAPDIYWQVYSPTWRSDGTRIGYVITFNGLRHISPNPSPLDFGEALQTDQSAMPTFVDAVAWGPASRANQVLYVGNQIGVSEAIYLLAVGDDSAGEPLVTRSYLENIRGLAWLPDGSGFIFSAEELDFVTPVRANVYEYRFAGQQIIPITSFADDFAGQLSVSPDGTQIVLERAASPDYDADTDLWLVNRNGSGLRLLVENGRAPAWGSGSAPVVDEFVFLPGIVRP